MEQFKPGFTEEDGSGREWPRSIVEIDCPNCDKPVAVTQTSYGARAICRPCRIRWTTLFCEPGAWTDERYSPLTDNTTQGRSAKDIATGSKQFGDSSLSRGDEP